MIKPPQQYFPLKHQGLSQGLPDSNTVGNLPVSALNTNTLQQSPQFSGWIKDIFMPGPSVPKSLSEKELNDMLKSFKDDVALENEEAAKVDDTFKDKLLQRKNRLLTDGQGEVSQADLKFSGLFGSRKKQESLSGIQPLDVETLQKQALKGEMNISLEVKPGKELDVEIQPDAKVLPGDPDIATKGDYLKAGFRASYGVSWSIEKCVRDILQNFSDAHGTTLEGTNISVTKNKAGQYEIKIEGRGEYDHNLLEKLGASTKLENGLAAGGFGEGAKVLSLIMLRDGLAEGIEFSSRNWSYDFKLKDDSEDAPMLRRFEVHDEDKPGNFVKITTTSKEFVNKMIEGLNYFYHANNQDFIDATHENEKGGFKYLGLEGRGNLYVTGQRFEYTDPITDTDHWEAGLEGLHLWSREKVEFWDRDRSAIGPKEVGDKMDEILSAMTPEDVSDSVLALIEVLEDKDVQKSLDGKKSKIKEHYNNTAAKMLLNKLIAKAETEDIKVDFPETWVSLNSTERSWIGNTTYLSLKRQDYRFFDADLRKIGMRTGMEFHPYPYSEKFDKYVVKPAKVTGKVVATPVVIAAGAVGAAAVVTGKGVAKAAKETNEHVLSPIGRGAKKAGRAVEHGVETAAKTTYNYTLAPAGRGVKKATQLTGKGISTAASETYDHVLAPTGRGVKKAGSMTKNGVVTAASETYEHVLAPTGRGVKKAGSMTKNGVVTAASETYEHVLAPTGRGVKKAGSMTKNGVVTAASETYDHVLTPIGHGATGAAKAAKNGANKTRLAIAAGATAAGTATASAARKTKNGVTSGVKTGYEHTLVPVGRGVKNAVDSVFEFVMPKVHAAQKRRAQKRIEAAEEQARLEKIKAQEEAEKAKKRELERIEQEKLRELERQEKAKLEAQRREEARIAAIKAEEIKQEKIRQEKIRQEELKKNRLAQKKLEHSNLNVTEIMQVDILKRVAEILGKRQDAPIAVYDYADHKKKFKKDSYPTNNDPARQNIWLNRYSLSYSFDKAVRYYLEELQRPFSPDSSDEPELVRTERSIDYGLEILKFISDGSPEGQRNYLELLELNELWNNAVLEHDEAKQAEMRKKRAETLSKDVKASKQQAKKTADKLEKQSFWK